MGGMSKNKACNRKGGGTFSTEPLSPERCVVTSNENENSNDIELGHMNTCTANVVEVKTPNGCGMLKRRGIFVEEFTPHGADKRLRHMPSGVEFVSGCSGANERLGHHIGVLQASLLPDLKRKCSSVNQQSLVAKNKRVRLDAADSSSTKKEITGGAVTMVVNDARTLHPLAVQQQCDTFCDENQPPNRGLPERVHTHLYAGGLHFTDLPNVPLILDLRQGWRGRDAILPLPLTPIAVV